MSRAASKVDAWVFGQEEDRPALDLFLPLPFLPFLPSLSVSSLPSKPYQIFDSHPGVKRFT